MSTNPVVVKYTCERQTEVYCFCFSAPFCQFALVGKF